MRGARRAGCRRGGGRRSGPRPFAVAFAIALVTVSTGFLPMLWAEHTLAYVPPCCPSYDKMSA
jgi:hypothetical protein